jgi:cytochrome c oxidase subunit 2
VIKRRLPRVRVGHVALLSLLLISLLAAGCIGDTDTPQNTLAPEGEVAEKQRDLFMLAMWPALAVMILVEVGLVFMVLRWRRRSNDEMPKQTHGNTPLEIGWTIIPTLIIIGFVGIPMTPVLFDLGRDPKPDAYPVIVTGFQWAWQFDHPEIEGPDGQPVSELGELHIPAGREISITLHSLDVNHSFGVPRLAGTRDAVPGREDVMWIKADHPGSFAGQCRELCGVGHAEMKLTVIAQSEEDFDAWSREMAAGTKTLPDDGPETVSSEGSGE